MFGIIWATKQEIIKDLGISLRTMDYRIAEFKKYIDQGRYSRYCLQQCVGYTRIDYVAFMDFMQHREWLKDRYLSKLVEPFNRNEIIKQLQLNVPEQQSVVNE